MPVGTQLQGPFVCMGCQAPPSVPSELTSSLQHELWPGLLESSGFFRKVIMLVGGIGIREKPLKRMGTMERANRQLQAGAALSERETEQVAPPNIEKVLSFVRIVDFLDQLCGILRVRSVSFRPVPNER